MPIYDKFVSVVPATPILNYEEFITQDYALPVLADLGPDVVSGAYRLLEDTNDPGRIAQALQKVWEFLRRVINNSDQIINFFRAIYRYYMDKVGVPADVIAAFVNGQGFNYQWAHII